MQVAQFRDGQGKWQNIPMTGFTTNIEGLAFQYSKQHGVHTRVADIQEGKDPKEIKVFSCVLRRR